MSQSRRTVRGVLFTENGELVFIKRTKAAGSYYVFVGGGSECSDATPQDTLRREAREELGIEIEFRESEVFSTTEDYANKVTPQTFYLATTTLKTRCKNAEIDKPQDPANSYELALFPANLEELSSLNILPLSAKQYLLQNLPKLFDAAMKK